MHVSVDFIRGIRRFLTQLTRYSPANMRNNWIELREQQELIASFGGAEIVKHSDGRLEIRSGTEEERARARVWMRQFLVKTPVC